MTSRREKAHSINYTESNWAFGHHYEIVQMVKRLVEPLGLRVSEGEKLSRDDKGVLERSKAICVYYKDEPC